MKQFIKIYGISDDLLKKVYDKYPHGRGSEDWNYEKLKELALTYNEQAAWSIVDNNKVDGVCSSDWYNRNGYTEVTLEELGIRMDLKDFLQDGNVVVTDNGNYFIFQESLCGLKNSHPITEINKLNVQKVVKPKLMAHRTMENIIKFPVGMSGKTVWEKPIPPVVEITCKVNGKEVSLSEISEETLMKIRNLS